MQSYVSMSKEIAEYQNLRHTLKWIFHAKEICLGTVDRTAERAPALNLSCQDKAYFFLA